MSMLSHFQHFAIEAKLPICSLPEGLLYFTQLNDSTQLNGILLNSTVFYSTQLNSILLNSTQLYFTQLNHISCYFSNANLDNLADDTLQ